LPQAETITEDSAQLYIELWVSLASLLRSYTAAHGLNGNRQATVELGEATILIRHGDNWLDLERDGATVNWKSSNGTSGTLELTEHGRLRSVNNSEQEMDMAAEQWAGDLMREPQS
jgi:hypothetical protein